MWWCASGAERPRATMTRRSLTRCWWPVSTTPIRGAAQEIDSAGNIVPKSIRVVVRGRAAKLTGGKLKRASTMDSGVTLNILYILIEVNGESVVELDKMNPTYKVNGVDLLAEYKEMC